MTEPLPNPNSNIPAILRLDFSFPHEAKALGFQQIPHSLDDGDIILVKPPTLPFNCVLAGKNSLSGVEALQFLDRCEHWRGEMQQALKAGKTIFVFCCEPLAAVGEHPQNPEERLVYSNYRLLPIENAARVFIPRRGKRTQLVGTHDAFTKFWKEFRELSEYHAQFREPNLKPLVRTGDGAGVVGGSLEFPNDGARSGFLVLLPELDLGDSPGDGGEAEEEWAKRNKAFEQHLRRIDRELRLSPSEEPAPDWLHVDRFQLQREEEIRAEIEAAESLIAAQSQRRDTLLQTLEEETRLRSLLFAKGPNLEHAVRVAFTVLGFTVEHYQTQDFEFDCLITSQEGRCLCEVEGKDSQPIGLDKIRQLAENLGHDSRRSSVQPPAKGILCGNAFRQTEPSLREAFFTPQCVEMATQIDAALLRTPDLFAVAKHIMESSDADFAERCRKAIFAAEGEIVRFPSLNPESGNGESPSE